MLLVPLPLGYSLPPLMFQDHLEDHIGQAMGATFHSCHRRPLFVILLCWDGRGMMGNEASLLPLLGATPLSVAEQLGQ